MAILRAHALRTLRTIARPFSASAHSRPYCTPAGASGTAQEEEPKMHMVFTCNKCNTRSVKSFTKRAYTHGVVIATCPGCEARHLIADNLNWFGEERNIEEVMRKRGVRVPTLRDGALEFSEPNP